MWSVAVVLCRCDKTTQRGHAVVRGSFPHCSLVLIFLYHLFLCPFSCEAAWSCLAQTRWCWVKKWSLSYFVFPGCGGSPALKHISYSKGKLFLRTVQVPFDLSACKVSKIQSLSWAWNLLLILYYRWCDHEGAGESQWTAGDQNPPPL